MISRKDLESEAELIANSCQTCRFYEPTEKYRGELGLCKRYDFSITTNRLQTCKAHISHHYAKVHFYDYR